MTDKITQATQSFREALGRGSRAILFDPRLGRSAAIAVNEVIGDPGIQNIHHVGGDRYVIEYLPGDPRRNPADKEADRMFERAIKGKVKR
jgi:hypothetical protein